MTDKNAIIVDAAAQLFARYGFAKTTMGDIAQKADVARQTVYNAFPGKNEILRAVVRQVGNQIYSDVTRDWADMTTLEEKLNLFLQAVPINTFETICAAPDMAELLDGLNKVASEEMDALHLRWRAALMDQFQASGAKPANPDGVLEDIVDFFYASSLNAKYGVSDAGVLRTRLETLKTATLALIRV